MLILSFYCRIKKAYRRKALELHPDRNYGKEEQATSTFAEIQAAYEVLSDPQERAWYDSHEGAILRGFDGTEEEDNGSGGGRRNYGYNIKLTTSDDISHFIGAFHGRKIDYDNVPTKFFTELAELFAKLASEESIAARMEGIDIPSYPPFGVREDDYDTVVKPFYAAWVGFATQKTYFWEDKYHLTDASDRRIRRAMEKENKKFRDDAIRDFNDTVRMLVSFVRKRDSRYKPNFQTDAERQKALREASAAQAARSRAANEAKMQEHVPEWTKVQELKDDEESEEEEIIEQLFECVACHKTFKSEKQFDAHERSKKHQQTVKALIRKMRKENDSLHLDDVVSSGVATPMQDGEELSGDVGDDLDMGDAIEGLEISTDSNAKEPQAETTNTNANINEEVKGTETTSEEENVDHNDDEDEDEDGDEDSNDEYASRESVISRFAMGSVEDETMEKDKSYMDKAKPKLGKAAQKRARKAAQRASAVENEQELRVKCNHCNAAFPSRTRLFQHLESLKQEKEQEDHAAFLPQASRKKGKR